MYRRVTGMVALSLFLFTQGQAADVYLGLQAFGGGGKQLGVGLATFTSATSSGDTAALAEKLRSVLREDLLFTRYFNIVEGGPVPSSGKLDSVAWGSLGAQVVITGDVRLEGQTVTLDCKIMDAASGKTLYDKQGDAVWEAWRRLTHLIADQLTYQLSGQPGIAHTRIAFVNNQTRHKEIYVMDYDGANVVRMTFDHTIDILPVWSPDGKSIVFNSYKAQNPDAYLMDYPSGSVHHLSMRQGLNTAPHWSPDGNNLAITLSRGGDPDLFLIDRTGRILRRLTYAPGVDTSPNFSPNGQQIVFVSDRSGNPELYVMDTTGANTQRLTYGQWVDAPAWSPKGDLIAYERQRAQAQYDIYTIDPSGRNNQNLTDGNGGRNESPSWSPDGRFIVFTSTRNNGRRIIYTMGADGGNAHAVGDLPAESFDPSWGP